METDPLWFHPMTQPRLALQLAAAHFPAVHSGWQSLWYETLRQLVAARTPARVFAMTYLSLEVDDGVLRIDMPHTDVVLEGIARRCEARSRFICMQCGNRGLWRQFSMCEGAPLCAPCAAPELLHRAIEDTVEYGGLMLVGGYVRGVSRVPDVLRRSFTQAAQTSRKSGNEPSMDKAAFRAWVEDLKRLKTALPPSVVPSL